MPIEVRKKEGESPQSFLYRFNKKVQQSGILKETKRRRFYRRAVNKRKLRLSALHREAKKKDFIRMRKMGII